MKNEYYVKGNEAVILLKRKGGEVLEAIIDLEDLTKVREFPNTWYAMKNKMGTFYVAGEIANGSIKKGTFKKKTHLLHRVIMNPPNGMVVDHINHNTLDNRKENLRVLTLAENNQNKNIDYIIGVYPYHYDDSKWVAYDRLNGKTVNLGIYEHKKDAERAVVKFKKKHHPYSKVVEFYANT